MPSILEDSRVRRKLADATPADDILVLKCPECDEWGYYGDNSVFRCRFCEVSFKCISAGAETPKGRYIVDDGVITTVADVLKEESE